MNIITDSEKGYAVFDTLIEANKQKRPPYDTAKVPQAREFLPKDIVWGSREHAIYLFCACYYMRGGIQSMTAFTSLAKLYTAHPEIFDPFAFTDRRTMKIEWMQECIKHFGLSFQSEEIARFWVVNFTKLAGFWKGDPTSLYDNVVSYEELCRRIIGPKVRSQYEPEGFYGFQEKMTSMLTYFLVYCGIISCDYIFPVPVDFHVLRILSGHEILTSPELKQGQSVYSEQLLAAARDLSVSYCRDRSVSPLALGDALWLLSSNMCRYHPGNTSIVGERQGRSTEVSPLEYEWTTNNVDRYYNTCARCPIEPSCFHHVAAADYYVTGKLILRAPRQKPPQLFLPNTF